MEYLWELRTLFCYHAKPIFCSNAVSSKKINAKKRTFQGILRKVRQAERENKLRHYLKLKKKQKKKPSSNDIFKLIIKLKILSKQIVSLNLRCIAQFGTFVQFKNVKNTYGGVLLLVKLKAWCLSSF